AVDDVERAAEVALHVIRHDGRRALPIRRREGRAGGDAHLLRVAKYAGALADDPGLRLEVAVVEHHFAGGRVDEVLPEIPRRDGPGSPGQRIAAALRVVARQDDELRGPGGQSEAGAFGNDPGG